MAGSTTKCISTLTSQTLFGKGMKKTQYLTLIPDPLSCICSSFSPPCLTVTCMEVDLASKLKKIIIYTFYYVVTNHDIS